MDFCLSMVVMPPVSPHDARAPLVLVLDAGSSSLRGAVYDALARPVDGWEVRDQHPLHATPDGGVEVGADEVVARIAGIIDRALIACGTRARDIRAVGMASLASTLVGVDAAGTALTPVYVYSDTRPAAVVRELRARLDETAVHQRTGCRLHTSYLPPRLLWLRRTSPDAFRRVRRWLSMPELVYLRLTGEVRASYSIASWSGLLNRTTLEWDREWLGLLDVDVDTLSPLNDAPLRGLRPEYARRWPALADARWFPAVADGAASNVGSGCTGPEQVALSIGTSGAMRVVTESPPDVLPPGLWCYRVDRRRALVGGALNEGGGVIAWVQSALRLEDLAAAEAALAGAEPDGHGLTVLPFLAGERSPGWNPEMRFTLTGAGLSTGPVEVLQATMESVAYRFGLLGRELAGIAPYARRMVASGGGAAGSPVWLQMIADVLGRTVVLSEEVEATSRGIAVLALGALPGHDAAIPPSGHGRMFEPRTDRHARYAAAIERQQSLYARLVDWQGL